MLTCGLLASGLACARLTQVRRKDNGIGCGKLSKDLMRPVLVLSTQDAIQVSTSLTTTCQSPRSAAVRKTDMLLPCVQAFSFSTSLHQNRNALCNPKCACTQTICVFTCPQLKQPIHPRTPTCTYASKHKGRTRRHAQDRDRLPRKAYT